MASIGGIEAIGRAMDLFPDSDRVNKAAKNALEKAKDLVKSDPNAFGKNLDGLAALMKAYAGDSKALRDLMQQIASAGGMENLLSMLGGDAFDHDMMGDLLRSMREAIGNGSNELHILDPKAIAGILKGLRSDDKQQVKDILKLIKIKL